MISSQADTFRPSLSVVIPTFNNEAVLRRCLASWRIAAAGQPVELIVIEDGCRDGTSRYLEGESHTAWGRQHLRWIHMDDAHELRCTNAGLSAARSPLVMAWQDDMFVRARWLVPEIVRTFGAHADIGLMSLSRGLEHHPLDTPIATWEDLVDWRRLRSTIGPFPGNWIRIQEVDAVIRPWVVRRACLDRVGILDEAFVPTEWDEADLAYRIREAGWKVGTCGYERLEGYEHLGSSTIGDLSSAYKQRVLKNGLLFHSRWSHVVAREHARARRTWPRYTTLGGWMSTARGFVTRAFSNGSVQNRS
jgi:glycosyltransferase involved in cell wall biosynthesis